MKLNKDCKEAFNFQAILISKEELTEIEQLIKLFRIGIFQNNSFQGNYFNFRLDEEDPESKLIIVLKVVEGQQLNNVYLVGENGA